MKQILAIIMTVGIVTLAIGLKVGAIAFVVWIIVKVLQAMGVLG